MTIESFLNELGKRTIDADFLRTKGFDEEILSDMLQAFHPKKNKYQSKQKDMLLNFIESYENSLSLLGKISIYNEIRETIDYWIVGSVNEDMIGVDKVTNEVALLYYYDLKTISFYIAEDTVSFFEAYLIHGIAYRDKEILDRKEILQNNLAKAKQAAIAAGGEKYFDFWKFMAPTES